MIQYGSSEVHELNIKDIIPEADVRNEHYVDIRCKLLLQDGDIPDGITELSALVICLSNGTMIEIVPQDEGCDCEFQFTAGEKERIRNLVSEHPDLKRFWAR